MRISKPVCKEKLTQNRKRGTFWKYEKKPLFFCYKYILIIIVDYHRVFLVKISIYSIRFYLKTYITRFAKRHPSDIVQLLWRMSCYNNTAFKSHCYVREIGKNYIAC